MSLGNEHSLRVGGLASPQIRVFANIRADFRAHGGDLFAPGFWALMVYRLGRWRYRVSPFVLRKSLAALYWIASRLVHVILGIRLPCEVVVGRNFVIEYSGDITISSDARIGDNCRIRSGECAALVGNNVDIGAGARLLGGIRVGDNAVIAANAVVTHDVPRNSVALGATAAQMG